MLPALAPELGSHVTAETHKSALELRSRVHKDRARRRPPSWGTCARALDGQLRHAGPARGGERHPPVRGLAGDSRVHRPALPARLRLDARARAPRAHLRAPRARGRGLARRRDRADEPACAATCRCCSRCPPTRRSGRAATPAWPRPARRSSRRSRAWASRGRSATTPTGSRRWTCCCAARRSTSPPSSGGTCARSRASAPWRCGSSTCRAPWPRPWPRRARAVHRPARARGGVHAARGARTARSCSRRTASSPTRDGMDARLLDPVSERLVPARLQLDLLLEACLPHAHALGCVDELASVRALAEGTGAARQLELARGRTGCPGWCRPWPRCSPRTPRPAPMASLWPGVRRPAASA